MHLVSFKYMSYFEVLCSMGRSNVYLFLQEPKGLTTEQYSTGDDGVRSEVPTA